MNDRTRNSKSEDDFQVPLMNVFRSAADAKDVHVADDHEGTGDRVISQRAIERRQGTGHDKLREYLLADLANLMGTIHLEAAEELEEFPHVKESILNYGVQDVSSLTIDQVGSQSILRKFKEALIAHEPRLIADTVRVQYSKSDAEITHKLSFDVEAIMAARPVDVPLEFVAEIDVAEAKVKLSKLSVTE
ncbi:MAG: GPW/gp25 family protein [Pseudomonadota bacterium]